MEHAFLFPLIGSGVFPNSQREEESGDINQYSRDVVDTGGNMFLF